MVQRIVVAEAGNGSVSGGFVKFDADTEEADDATCGDETRGVEAAGGDFRFEGYVAGGDGAEEGTTAGVGVGGIRGIEVRMLGEPCFAVGVPERERGIVVELRLPCGVTVPWRRRPSNAPLLLRRSRVWWRC